LSQGLGGNSHEFIIFSNVSVVGSDHFLLGSEQIASEFGEEVKNFLDGTLIGVVLGELDESLGEMAPGVGDPQFLDELVDMGFGGVQLNEVATLSLEASQEVDAFLNGSDRLVIFLDISFENFLVVVSLRSGGFTGSDGFSFKSLVGSDQLFEFLSLGIERIDEMSAGNSESDFGISEFFVPLNVEFVVLSGSPSVLLVFRVKLEVQVSDEVLEGGNEFRHGSSSLDLKFHEASGDLSPAGLLELVDLVFHVELEA